LRVNRREVGNKGKCEDNEIRHFSPLLPQENQRNVEQMERDIALNQKTQSRPSVTSRKDASCQHSQRARIDRNREHSQHGQDQKRAIKQGPSRADGQMQGSFPENPQHSRGSKPGEAANPRLRDEGARPQRQKLQAKHRENRTGDGGPQAGNCRAFQI